MNIKQVAEALEFKQVKNVYCKDIENFHLTLMMMQPRMAVVATCIFVLNRQIDEEVYQAIIDQYGKKSFRYQQNYLFLEFPKLTNSFKKKDEDIQEALELISGIINLLSSYGYSNYSKCAFCGNDEDIVYDVVNNLYLPIHRECLQNAINQAAKEVDQENDKIGRLPLSIMLAVAGAIVGLIPTIVMILLTETIYALLFTLIPICAMVGYKIGGAPRNKIMTTVTIICSISVVLGFSIINYLLSYLALGISFSEFIAVNGPVILGDLATNLLFIGIGIWISWKLISNTKENQYKDLKK